MPGVVNATLTWPLWPVAVATTPVAGSGTVRATVEGEFAATLGPYALSAVTEQT